MCFLTSSMVLTNTSIHNQPGWRQTVYDKLKHLYLPQQHQRHACRNGSTLFVQASIMSGLSCSTTIQTLMRDKIQ